MLWNAIFDNAQARGGGERLAVVSTGASVTYAELITKVEALARRLAQAGVGPGHVVLGYLDNAPAFPVALLAATKLGAAFAPLDIGLTETEAAGLLALTQSRLVIGGGHEAARCRRLAENFVILSTAGDVVESELGAKPAPSIASNIGCIQFSSGTSGAPKGILLGHEAFYYRSYYLTRALGLGPDDRTLCTLPLSHPHGAECLMLPTLLAGGTVYLEAPKLSFPLYVLEELEKRAITFFSTIPQFYDFASKLAVSRPPDLRALRLPFCGSAALARSTAEAFFSKYGVHIQQGYGLAELAVICANIHRGDRIAYDTVGKPIEGIEWKLDGGEREGELLVRSKAMFSGYLNADAQTDARLRDGWLHTGDMVAVDDAGLFRIVGRKEDFIKVNGFKVYAAEIEQAIIGLDWVKECAVLAEKDAVGTERIVAHIVPTESERSHDAIERELTTYLRTCLSDYKLPKKYVTWRELPKSAMGKILKSRLIEPSRGDHQ